MDKKEIGHRIKTFMKQRGLTQEQVASDLGLKQPSISGMIAGKRDTIRLAMDMAEKYSVPREIFLGEKKSFKNDMAKRDIPDNGLTDEVRINLINNLERLYTRHQTLLDNASDVMKEIAAINKLLILGTNSFTL